MKRRKETKSGSERDMEASGKKQCTVLQKLEMYAETMQSLVKYHGQEKRPEELWSQVCENDECGSSAVISTIAGYLETIRQVINGEKYVVKNTPESPSPQNPVDQPHDHPVDASGFCEKALNNSVVLRTIMKHLEAPDLLRIRLLSKKWEEEATIQLSSSPRHNKFYKVEFLWDANSQKFLNKLGTLNEFTESCCSNPHRKFPCSQFRLHNVTTTANTEEPPVDLVNFLSKNGHNIKNLCLSSLNNSFSAFNIVHNQILGSTPRLQSLTFDLRFGPSSKTPSDCIEDRPGLKDLELSLKELQELVFETYFHVIPHERFKRLVRDILQAAPNLQRVSDPQMTFTQEIVSCGKIRTLRDVSASGAGVLLSRLTELSQASPAPLLESLEVTSSYFPGIHPAPTDLSATLHRTLESSRHTLKILKLGGRLDLENLDQIPVMENVEEIILDSWSDFLRGRGRGIILPPGFTLQASFPRLKVLAIQDVVHEEAGGHEDDPFNYTCNSSTTVEQLSIAPDSWNKFHPSWLDQSRVLYPNVRILHLEVHQDWNELLNICSTVWKAFHDSPLEQLHFDLEYCSDFTTNGNFTTQMDAVFTGIDLKTCKELRKQGDSKNGQVEQEFQRDYSIMSMQNLKLFQITGKPAEGNSPLFSRLSVIHAFDPMKYRQNLRVVINEVELESMIQVRNVDFWEALYT